MNQAPERTTNYGPYSSLENIPLHVHKKFKVNIFNTRQQKTMIYYIKNMVTNEMLIFTVIMLYV